MKLRLKIFFLSIVSMSIALGSVIFTVRHQTLKLAQQEKDLVESSYLASKEAELRSYVKLAQSSIAPLVSQPASPVLHAAAIAILSQLEFGTDGHFFVYDMDGKNLVNPRQPDLVGKNLWGMKDPSGDFTVQRLLAAARAGGGIVRYYWHKPSAQQLIFKLGYVEPVLPWGWMLGTGLHLDDIEQTLKSIDVQAQANIRETQVRMYTIALVTILAINLIGIAGLVLNIIDNRVARLKLRRLAQRVVHSQEEERIRVARELHDGIIQVLVSSKFLLETSQLQLENMLAPTSASGAHLKIKATLGRGLDRLNQALLEVRRISHGLRPALLDDFGLVPAMEVLTNEVREQCCFNIRFVTSGQPYAIPISHSTALFRISQETLTNARLHSGAANVLIEVIYSRRHIRLCITDDGKGFDVKQVQADRRSRIGLRNMRERMEGLGGTFVICSGCCGTQVKASLMTASDNNA